MGGNAVCRQVFVADVVAVVDDGLRAVDEVTGGLPFFSISIGSLVIPFKFADGILVQLGQSGVLMARYPFAMLVLGIDVAAADTSRDIDKIHWLWQLPLLRLRSLMCRAFHSAKVSLELFGAS